MNFVLNSLKKYSTYSFVQKKKKKEQTHATCKVQLIYKNREVVANKDKEMGRMQTIQMRIDTGDHYPIKLRPYRTPILKRKLVEEAVKDMLEYGVIEPSKSPWSFPDSGGK